jgi:hypothetical protein
LSARNTFIALQKENVTNCLVCKKFIPEDLQSHKRKYCSPACKYKSAYAREGRKRESRKVLNLDYKSEKYQDKIDKAREYFKTELKKLFLPNKENS